MIFQTFSIILLFSAPVLCKVDSLLTPCPVEDFACLSKSSDEFLKKTLGGVGEPYNIKPLEPLEMATFEIPGCCGDSSTTTLRFKNNKVYGISTAKLTGFRMDQATKVLNINMTLTYRVTSDLEVEVNNKAKTYAGTTELKNAKVAVQTTYSFVLETDDKGEHLVIGPETTTCEAQSDPEVTFNTELQEAINNDTELAEKREKHAKELAERRKKFACKINAFAFPKLLDGWRKATRVMSTSDLFNEKIGQ